MLSQSLAILNYIGTTYGLRPTDAMTAYKGDKAIARIFDDFKHPLLNAARSGDGTDEEKAARMRNFCVD